MDSRRSRLLGPAGGVGAGLEIGALNHPILAKGEHDVLYVDYAATEVVRANQFDPAINPADIVEVDIVWGETPLREAVGRPVDYVVASHVIEHVPDLIGWLLELHQVLRPGGVLGLAVPDKRYTFDALRANSTLAEAVEAYLLGYRQPSLRQVFDAASLGVAVDAAEVWAGNHRPDEARGEVLARLPSAYGLAQGLLAAPRYNDAHCWVFTPASFLDLVEEFSVLGLFPFRIEAFHPTEPGQIEFQLRLTALAAGEEPEAAASIATARATLSPTEPPVPMQVQDQELAADNRRLREALEAIRTSTSWRITAPVRSLLTALRARA